MPKNSTWSDWLDFNHETISKVPDASGVYMVHASMKVLFIEGAKMIREDLERSLSNPCISQATRFRYMITKEYEKTRNDLITDYKNRHEGNLPKCM